MTQDELVLLIKGRCPSCGDFQGYELGPVGGASRNLKMKCCGAKINVVDPDRYGWPVVAPFGQMLDED